MKFKFNALVAALALVATAGANATMVNNNVNPGSSSVLFVAVDNAHTVSFVADLGVTMTDFLQGSTFVGATGSLAYAGSGVTAAWNLTADSRTVNGSAVNGGYNWASQFSAFTAAAGANYTWGVIAGDNISGAVSATNTVLNRSLFTTASPSVTNANLTALSTSTPVSTANGYIQNFIPAQLSQAGQTHTTSADGASVATSGTGQLWTNMKQNFGGQVAWSYLSNVGDTAVTLLAVQATNPTVYSLGKTYGVDSLQSNIADAATFTFDGTTLTYSVAAVPEASTIAMMLAGLGAVGFAARRRKAA